jgi:tRNA(Ile)-lysidine synthase
MLYQDPNRAIEEFWRKNCPQSCGVCVALSGGSDSVALFYLLAEMAGLLGITKLGIVHVNHALRGKESNRDARFVRRIARLAGVSFHMKEIDKNSIPVNGIEEWARNQRYAFFKEVIKTHAYDFVATAHTANDQAETMLLRLMRGSGISGLIGIAPIREDGIIRPLLGIKKDSLRKWLGKENRSFCEDSTNADVAYTRNWVRHEIMPVLEKKEPALVQHLVNVADNASAVNRILYPITNNWIHNNVVVKEGNKFSIKKCGLLEADVAAEAMVVVFRKYGISFDRRHIATLLKNRIRNSGEFLLPGGWRYSGGKEALEFFKQAEAEGREVFRFDLPLRGTTVCKEKGLRFVVTKIKSAFRDRLSFSDSMTAFLDAGKLDNDLEYRSWDPFDRFWPYGAKRYCGLAGFLKKQGVALKDRLKTGVVALKQGEIVWIPGLRINHKFRITHTTTTVVKISCKNRG